MFRLEAENRGRWWKAGASWQGRNLNKSNQNATQDNTPDIVTNQSNKVQEVLLLIFHFKKLKLSFICLHSQIIRL